MAQRTKAAAGGTVRSCVVSFLGRDDASVVVVRPGHCYDVLDLTVAEFDTFLRAHTRKRYGSECGPLTADQTEIVIVRSNGVDTIRSGK